MQQAVCHYRSRGGNKQGRTLNLPYNCSLYKGLIAGMRCALPCQKSKPVSIIEFVFTCLDLTISFTDLQRYHCQQMQKNGIYRMPKQIGHVTPPEFQLPSCLGTFPISVEPPEASKAQRYSCQGQNRDDKAFLLRL